MCEEALMPRITRDMVDAKVIRLNRMGVPLVIEYGGEPQRPRVYLKAPEGTWEKELSPRLPKKDMYEWLDAFEKGFGEGYKESQRGEKFKCPACDYRARWTMNDAMEYGEPMCHHHAVHIPMEAI
jgi:hypothetical protein